MQTPPHRWRNGGLPGQPSDVRYIASGGVTQGMLDDAAKQYASKAQDLQLQRSIKESERIEALTRKDWVGQLRPCKNQVRCTIA